jgi:hypothetical protein
MRGGWLGLVAVAALVAACGGDDTQPQPPPPPPPPPPATYKVGGTIAGLTGSITLQLNGAENLTRSANGPFTFQTELDDQSTFTVAITAPPTEQDCSLQEASGKVSGADITSIRVTCTQRTYTLGGTVEGLVGTLPLTLDGGETLSLTANGAFTFQARRPRGSTYAVTLGAAARGYRCALTQGSGTVEGHVQNITVRCHPYFELTSFQAATLVIGQPDFTSNISNQEGDPARNTLDGPWGNPVLAGGRLYLPDLGSNRILGFNALPTQSNAAADFVLGQPDFMSILPRSGSSGFSSPEGSASDGTRLAVADKGNHRVLLYNALPTSTEAQADLVLGQPDFTTTAAQCDARSMRLPEDVSLRGGKLAVADTSNHRILIWNTPPTSSEAPADLVIGQRSLTTCAGNDANGDGTSDGAPTASTLFYPGGVWTDGTRLMVADTDNHRVLLWNTFPTTNGQPADVVLGQPGFTSRVAATSAQGLNAPYIVNSTGQQLFVADTGNHRVLVWNALSPASGTAADVVLGQPDFTSSNRGDPAPGATPSARSLYQPAGVLLAPPYLLVSDSGNNRALLFESR